MTEPAESFHEVLAGIAPKSSARAREAIERHLANSPHAGSMNAPALHRLARAIGRDHGVAQRLWASGEQTARFLAPLVEISTGVTPQQMESWVREFDSWGLVDCCCRYLFLDTRHAWKKAVEWSRRTREFEKRAGFSLMAYLAIHDKSAKDARFHRLLKIVERHATDERHFVKKAANWALRQIGKRNLRLNRAALQTARRIHALDSRAARWIASDAIRELSSKRVARRLRARRR